MKIGFVSLGCPKNQVDGERILWTLFNVYNHTLAPAEEADIVIINTCGFIQSAKEEAIDTILEFADLKSQGRIKHIIVTGCLAERYKEEVKELLPEVDAVIGLGKNKDIHTVIEELSREEDKTILSFGGKADITGKRMLLNAPYTAYLSISDGCSNNCTYCAIPQIRSKYRSVPIEDIITQAEELIALGVTELILVAQDTTMYGIDLYKKYALPELLKKLCEFEQLHWIRILYTYPERITDELLDVMAENEKIVNYLDMPIQHCNKDILKSMNRKGDRETLNDLISKIRNKLPDVTLRTTLIAGFPGETDLQFEELAEFVKKVEFDRLGCFAYSQEEGTKAAEFEDQIDEDIKQHRAELIEDMQRRITENKCNEKVGKILEVLTESYDTIEKIYCGRTKSDTPDIDCKVYFKSSAKIKNGEYINVKIEDVMECDLLGVV
ncbi:MAG: 30S ribosomal protein S12 methylthiotransferase RimO [Oscillospiraceae bacterium]|jgi:ribosomal protein S12 methylthiotransferase|nr:30S ribosomal protein S12 methylthiotransferase RimO [Oscillospiraceae bacterium]